MHLTHPSLALAACLLLTAVVLPGCSGSGGNPEGAGDGTTGGSTPSTESSPGATAEGRALVLDRCTRCHGVTRIKQASKDEDEWRSTVARMRENGAQVDDEEAETIIGFLASGGAEQL